MTNNFTAGKGFSIAIDGPVASGKGTIAPLLAKALFGFHLYTGGMYRSVALYCLQNGVDLTNQSEVESVLHAISVRLDDGRIFLNNTDVTEDIKREDVGMGGSTVATYPRVRADLVLRQQKIVKEKIAQGNVVIAEGRDTATKVLPDALLRVFLTARPHVRAERRLRQIQQRGKDVSYDEVLKDLQMRDQQDSTRATDPLVSDPEKHGYFVLDSSDLTEEETVKAIVNELGRRGIAE